MRAIAAAGPTVYAGGLFTTIGGQGRICFAALDSTSGLATAWNPRADNRVNAIVVDDTTVYVGGQFSSAGGQTRNNLAALDSRTALATDWNPNPASAVTAFVSALARGGSALYAGGNFSSVLAWPRSNLVALSAHGVTDVPPAAGRILSNAVACPNPFAGRVSMAFDLVAPVGVRLEVTDVAGRRIWSSATAELGPGRHHLAWEGTLASGGGARAGIYFLRVIGPGFAITRPVVRVR